MASPSGSQNGGILGVSNKTSFGKNKITSKTSTGAVTKQSGSVFKGLYYKKCKHYKHIFVDTSLC